MKLFIILLSTITIFYGLFEIRNKGSASKVLGAILIITGLLSLLTYSMLFLLLGFTISWLLLKFNIVKFK
jgi:hypothetical protein